MIHQKEYDNALFIFNDDIEDFNTSKKGKGNAVIRQYNSFNKSLPKPRSAGIPTGSRVTKGFQFLSADVKRYIDTAINNIKSLISQYGYESVIYSADKNGNVDTSIFTIGNDVRDYITSQLKALK